MPYFELLVVLLLMVLNGVFAMSELAIVSAKKVHLRKLAEEGNQNAVKALEFAENTGLFLPTVQIGITLIGVLAGAFSGATLSGNLADYFISYGMDPEEAKFLAVTLIVVVITYLTLVIGELVPKELALRRPEGMALFVSPLIYWLAKITWPAVWLLNVSCTFVLKLLRAGDKPTSTVTQEEVSALIEEGTDFGVFEENERDMLSGVMLLSDKPIRAFMKPRVDVASLPGDATVVELREVMSQHSYSRFPVRDPENENHILGVVHIKDILTYMLDGKTIILQDMLADVPVFPDTADALHVLQELRASPVHLAIIIDEHGSFEGIITLTDILGIITGGVADDNAEADAIIVRDDGSWLVDGGVLIDKVFAEIGLNEKNDSEKFHTLAGFILNYFHSVPKAGSAFEHKDFRFEVVDIDGHRIDKVLIKRLETDDDVQTE